MSSQRGWIEGLERAKRVATHMPVAWPLQYSFSFF